MLNYASIDAVEAARTDAHLTVPLYGTYSFANVPSLIRSLLAGTPTAMPHDVVAGLAPARNVVFVLVDGFGWSFFERFADRLPFLRRIENDGVVSVLTSQFPSTTAAHVTTMHTGAAVGASGVYEWYYYEPELDEIFSPLKCYVLGPDGPRDVIPQNEDLYPRRTLYEDLAADGIPSFCYQSARYVGGPYSDAVTRGAQKVGFRTLPEGLVHLAERILAARQPTYHAVYVDPIDTIAHAHGPDSPFITAEILALFSLFEQQLATALAGTDTLLVVSADHGHTAVTPERMTYVDHVLPHSQSWLRQNRAGRPLVPAGSPRDMFFYAAPEHVDAAHDALTTALEDVATVHRTADLADGGYFGAVGDRLRARMAPLVILPRPHEMVWWRGGTNGKSAKFGYHGGLTRDEVEIPLLAWHL